MSLPEPGAGAPQLVAGRNAVLVGDREVALSATQYRLLTVLVRAPGRVFTRAELVEHGIGDLVEPRTVDVHIKEIRRKLGAHAALIQTVRRVGYCFCGDAPTTTPTGDAPPS